MRFCPGFPKKEQISGWSCPETAERLLREALRLDCLPLKLIVSLLGQMTSSQVIVQALVHICDSCKGKAGSRAGVCLVGQVEAGPDGDVGPQCNVRGSCA